MWSSEQVEKLYENEYALNLSNSLFYDVYPNIFFLMTELGMKQTEFFLGPHIYNKYQFYRCLIRLTTLEDNSNGLIILLQRVANIQRHTDNNDVQQDIEVIEYREFTFGFNEIYSEIIYYTEDLKSKKIDTREPMLYAGIFFNMCLEFKTALHFYLFYCEKIVEICEDLKRNYRDGFIKLKERINLLTFPLERKVLFEKTIINGN